MSDMLRRYESSNSPRVVAAKAIPQAAVNYFDVTSQFQENFTPGMKKGDPTKWTEHALNYFTEERKQIILPDTFQPIEQGVPVSRWSPEKKYFNPGQR